MSAPVYSLSKYLLTGLIAIGYNYSTVSKCIANALVVLRDTTHLHYEASKQ